MGWGGRRPGAGRPLGSRNLATVEREDLIKAGFTASEAEVVAAVRRLLAVAQRVIGPSRLGRVVAAATAEIGTSGAPAELFDEARPPR